MFRRAARFTWLTGFTAAAICAPYSSAPPLATAAPSSAKPAPFSGREQVLYSEFVSELRSIADDLSTDPDVRAAHRALLTQHNLSEAELPLMSFSRVRLIFEATRDGGLWELRWEITDEMPWSDQIWRQWRTRAETLQAAAFAPGVAGPSARAECDELSALFALLARDVGVPTGFVGLHWPYWNHVVAIWQIERRTGRKLRIVVPTSQVFLSPDATLGTTELPTQRVVFPYARRDLQPNSEIPGSVARFLLQRARELGGLSTAELSARRTQLGGS